MCNMFVQHFELLGRRFTNFHYYYYVTVRCLLEFCRMFHLQVRLAFFLSLFWAVYLFIIILDTESETEQSLNKLFLYCMYRILFNAHDSFTCALWTILMPTMWCLTGSQASDTRRDYIILCQQRHSGPQSGQCDGQVGLLFFLSFLCCHFCHLNGECCQQSLKSMHTYTDVLPNWCHIRSASIFWRRGVVKMLNL